MVLFTNDQGQQVEIADEEVTTIESKPNYNVIQARHNPSGQVMTKIVYTNPVRNNIGGSKSYFPEDGGVEGEIEELNSELSDDINENPPECTCHMGEAHLCRAHPGRALDPHGLNPSLTNPRGAGAAVISWRNLRLSAAIQGSKQQTLGRTAQVMKKITNIGAALGRLNQNTSVRNYPELLPMTTAEHWFDYIRNMNAIDVGAELSAEVSPQEQLAVYHFLKEWEMDPTHRAFRNRVNVGADIDSELTKGQIVYDIMTSRGPDPMKSVDFSKHRYDKMFRLGIDLLSSIRLNIHGLPFSLCAVKRYGSFNGNRDAK